MIYFFKSDNFVKIGQANNPKKRLDAIQVGTPHKIEVIGLMEGSFNKEKELHNMFKEYAVRGEWFHLTGDLIEYIDSLPKNLLWKYGWSKEEELAYKNPVKSHRLSLNISLEYLADLLGITKQSAFGLEKSALRRTISIGKLHKIAEVTGYTFDYRFVKKEV